jgi:hypothetical protein
MASKKRSSRAATKAARAILEPSREEMMVRQLVARMADSIVRLEKTVEMLVQTMCPEARRNHVLSTLTKGKAGDR